MARTMSVINQITSFSGRFPIYLTRLIRYGITGGLTFSFDLILLFFFVEFFGIYYLLAASMGFVIAHSCNYMIQRRWGFKESKSNMFGGYVYFIVFGVFGVMLTVYLLAVAVEVANLNYLFGRFLVSIVVGLMMFLLNYVVTFRMGKELLHR